MATTAATLARVRSPGPIGGAAVEQLWKVAALALLVTWLLVVGSRHEPWMDEAQAWLIARDSGLRELLVERVRYEGTPGLWHLILWVAIRCGLPYSLLFLIPVCFAASGAAVILWFSPFPRWLRAAILGSYFFAYQYGVIARSYSVDLLLIPLAAAWFGSRVEKPIRYALVVGLIANLNAHGFVAGAVLGAELLLTLFRSRRLRAPTAQVALATVAAMGLFALYCAWQPADNAFLREHRPPILNIINFILQAFVDRPAIFSTAGTTPLGDTLGFAIAILALWPSLRLIALGPQRWLALAMLVALLAFSGVTYAAAWHSGLLYLFWLVALWISWPAAGTASRELSAGLIVISIAQFAATVQSGLWDIRQVYSPGREAAAFVTGYRASHPSASTAAFGYKTFAMQPYWDGNQFDNYKQGAPHPAWLDWRRGQAWDPFAARQGWLKLLASKPDLIVASKSAAGGAVVPDATCESGYRVTHRFAGAMVWRGLVVENDTLLILERQVAPPHCP